MYLILLNFIITTVRTKYLQMICPAFFRMIQYNILILKDETSQFFANEYFYKKQNIKRTHIWHKQDDTIASSSKLQVIPQCLDIAKFEIFRYLPRGLGVESIKTR
jgi:hypothetical protein